MLLPLFRAGAASKSDIRCKAREGVARVCFCCFDDSCTVPALSTAPALTPTPTPAPAPSLIIILLAALASVAAIGCFGPETVPSDV